MKAINIILDESDREHIIFVGIQDDNGRPIDIGENTPLPNGDSRWRITPVDIDLIVPDFEDLKGE